MKLATIMVTLLAAMISWGSCGTMSCWDSCTTSYIPVYGDSCETTWDSDRTCYTAIGSCNGESGDDVCDGTTTSCWDSCTTSYVTVIGNSCTSAWDSSRTCYTAIGTCN